MQPPYLFCIQQKATLTKVACFSKIHCHTPFQDLIRSTTPPSQFRMSATLLLYCRKLNCKWFAVRVWTFTPNFIKIGQLLQTLKGRHTHTHTHTAR